ncbi:MAG: heavy metal translocating P-type ATPase [Thermoplasmata archaeon]|nr:heavy metal translocating P-type ATPase [Thermoplasmata archaeon]
MATDPICGMYVDERTATLRLLRGNRTYYFCSHECLQQFAQPAQELARLRRKLVVAWPLSVVVLVLAYVYHPPAGPWIALVLASVVEFYPGWQFFVGARDALRSRSWNMDVLIAVGTGVAYGYSLLALLLPTRLPAAYYFDASSLIVTLILTGNYLEHLTRERARGVLRRMQELLPAMALVLRSGTEAEIPVSEVQSGDLVRVRPGGKFPVDGAVAEGRSTVNEALLTGESLPLSKAPGDTVIGGSVNGEGSLIVRATRVGADTSLAQIGQLVAEAETSRVPLQRLADRIAAAFVPLVLSLAVLATVAWYLSGVGVAVAVLVLVSVVITACPCAFGIATPAAIVVGTGRAAEEGVLFKGNDSLERASRVDVILTDKTGTLTRGRPSLTDVLPLGGGSAEDLVRLAGAVEQGSEHPLARAVVEALRLGGGVGPPAIDVRAEPGRGVRGTVGGVEIAVLHGRAARELGVDLGPWTSTTLRLEAEGKAWSVVLRAGVLIGLLGFFDDVAPDVRAAIRTLASDGIPVVLVTGDHEAAARRVAGQVEIHEVHWDMTPRSKLDLIREFQHQGRCVAYVGDGINDAPALAAADLGIAVGTGADVAREAGGVILTRPGFAGVAIALRLGRRTVRKVRGNLTWAIGYNAVLLPVAMGALVPVFGIGVFLVLPITGAAAMALSSTSVVLNSLSLRWVRLGARRSARPGRPGVGPAAS